MTLPWHDPRVAAGTRRQLEARERRIRGGARHLGWKLAFGNAAAQERHGIGGPVVGHLTDDRLVRDGRSAIADWTAPRLEAELAVHLAGAPPPDGTLEDVANAIGGLGLAIELADLGDPTASLEDVLAGDVYHRAVVLGAPSPSTAPARVDIGRDGEPLASATELSDAVGGTPVELTRYVAAYLGAFGLALDAGDVIITGSVVPPLTVKPGERYDVAAGGFAPVSVTLG